MDMLTVITYRALVVGLSRFPLETLCVFLGLFLGSQPGNEVGFMAFCLVCVRSSTPVFLGNASHKRMRVEDAV